MYQTLTPECLKQDSATVSKSKTPHSHYHPQQSTNQHNRNKAFSFFTAGDEHQQNSSYPMLASALEHAGQSLHRQVKQEE